MIVISKEIEGDFGHRVWTQELDEKFAGTTSCKCKHLHGHRFKIVPVLDSETGLKNGMVTDFTHLKLFQKWVDKVMDHKLIMDINDPLMKHLFPKLNLDTIGAQLTVFNHAQGECQEGMSLEECELYEGLTIVKFTPTAENLANWLAHVLESNLPDGIHVQSLKFYETPKSYAEWIR